MNWIELAELRDDGAFHPIALVFSDQEMLSLATERFAEDGWLRVKLRATWNGSRYLGSTQIRKWAWALYTARAAVADEGCV